MTTDNPNFFDGLERELVAATSDRRRRLRRARARRAAGATTIAVAVLAAGGGLAAALTTSDATNNSAAPTTTAATAPRTVNGDRLVPPLPKPGSFTVAVLNGTTVPGLARGVATRLTIGKHKVGTVTNAATQHVTMTRIFYVPGARAAADEVAHGLEVAPDVIQPATPGVRVVAGDQAQVIVLVGSDQNTAPQSSH